MATVSFWENALSWGCRGLTVFCMLWALVRWCVRLVRVGVGGHLSSALPTAQGLGRRPGVRTLAFWVLAVLGLRLFQYALSYVLICRAAQQTLPLSDGLGSFWTQWDAYHYLKLSEQGYVSTGNDRLMLVFFPLYPALIALLRLTGLSTLYAGLTVSLVASCGCVLAILGLATPLYGKRAAQLACGYFLLNPLSIFLAAPYPEALFLCLTLGALWAAQRRRYVLAGLLGALSAFSRMLGLVVLGAILLEGLAQGVRERERRWFASPSFLRSLGGALIVPAGFLLYLGLNVAVSGAPFTFLEYQRANWSQQFGSFWDSMGTTVHMLFTTQDPRDFWGTWLCQAVAMLWVMALLMLRGRRLSLAHEAYSWVYLFLALAPTWLLSGPRYIMAMATLPLLQAQMSEKRTPHALSLILQGGLMIIFLYAYGIQRMIL